MNIDIKEVIEEAKESLKPTGSIAVCLGLSKKMLQGLEQQQELLNKIKADLINRADLKGDVCVGLSSGIWMQLCEVTLSKEKVNHE